MVETRRQTRSQVAPKAKGDNIRHVRFQSPMNASAPSSVTGRPTSAGTAFASAASPSSQSHSSAPPKLKPPSLTRISLGEHEALSELEATANERLEQARNFLSIEDFNFHQGFAREYEEIDDLLRKLSDKKIPCDLRLYEKVNLMAKVHRDRIERKSGMLVAYNEPLNLPYSQRLPTSDPVQKALTGLAMRKADRPPFTVDRRQDDSKLIKVMKEDTEQGSRLRLKQLQGYSEGLTDPSKAVEPTAGEDSVENRAVKRGRDAAALQIALQSFAGNHEQHYGDLLENRVTEAPNDLVAEVGEPVLSSSADLPGASAGKRKRKVTYNFELPNSDKDNDASGDKGIEFKEIWSFAEKLPDWSKTRNAFSLQFWSGYQEKKEPTSPRPWEQKPKPRLFGGIYDSDPNPVFSPPSSKKPKIQDVPTETPSAPQTGGMGLSGSEKFPIGSLMAPEITERRPLTDEPIAKDQVLNPESFNFDGNGSSEAGQKSSDSSSSSASIRAIIEKSQADFYAKTKAFDQKRGGVHTEWRYSIEHPGEDPYEPYLEDVMSDQSPNDESDKRWPDYDLKSTFPDWLGKRDIDSGPGRSNPTSFDHNEPYGETFTTQTRKKRANADKSRRVVESTYSHRQRNAPNPTDTWLRPAFSPHYPEPVIPNDRSPLTPFFASPTPPFFTRSNPASASATGPSYSASSTTTTSHSPRFVDFVKGRARAGDIGTGSSFGFSHSRTAPSTFPATQPKMRASQTGQGRRPAYSASDTEPELGSRSAKRRRSGSSASASGYSSGAGKRQWKGKVRTKPRSAGFVDFVHGKARAEDIGNEDADVQGDWEMEEAYRTQDDELGELEELGEDIGRLREKIRWKEERMGRLRGRMKL